MSNLVYLKDYAPFEATQELNEVVAQQLSIHKHELNETDRDIVITLSQYAVKYHGVAHLKAVTIAKAIDKSEITVRRSLRKLEQLGVIERRPFMRKVSGGNGANLYIFLPVDDKAEMTTRDESKKPTGTAVKGDIKKNEPIIFINNKDLLSNVCKDVKSHDNVTHNKDAKRCPNTPYNRFKEAVQTFIGDSIYNSNKSLLYRLYGVYLAQTKALRLAYDPSELIEVAIAAIRVTFTASKRLYIRNIPGYYNGVLSNMLDEMSVQLHAKLMSNAMLNVTDDSWAG